MSRSRWAVVAALPLLALAGCSLDAAGASVACEQLVDQRVNVAVVHRTPAEGGAVVTGSGPYVVAGAFTEPSDGSVTNYRCTVERVGDTWELVELVTDR